MATATVKFTAEVWICIATSGPGAVHLLNGLYDGERRAHLLADQRHHRVGERRDLDIGHRRQHMEMPLGDPACADEADPGHADPAARLPCRSASTIL